MLLSWLLSLSLAATCIADTSVPARSFKYRKTLHAEINRVWGLSKPSMVVPVSAGTIHQESAWNPLAQSAYAKGLTQFTDATWQDMLRLDPSIGLLGDVFNPTAAMRAMVTYHHALWGTFKAVDEENRWAFVLSAYNGGPGYVRKDQKLCATMLSCSPLVWWGNVERYSSRARWAFKENRGYPFNILKRWVPLYVQF